jgi:hypothetical protein
VSADDVLAFYRDALERETGFAGQLTDAFQAGLAAAHAGVTRGQCDFYHTMELGPGEVVPGAWDLRGAERAYQGFVDVAGLRVLEFGPATGYLSFRLEAQGAEVTCFDLAPGLPQDIIPQAGHDLDAQRRLSVEYAVKVRNSWWYSHRRLGSKARAVYGDIYALPRDIGRYDVSTFGCTLMHLSKPFFALQQAAAVTDKAIVVTEPMARLPADPRAPTIEFAPVDTARTVVLWWMHTPGAIARMLSVLGFFEATVHYHAQRHHSFHELDKPADEYLFFTVVGQRYPGQVRFLEPTAAERAREEEVKRRFGPGRGREEALQAELDGMRSSVSWRVSAPVRAVGSLMRRLGLRGGKP